MHRTRQPTSLALALAVGLAGCGGGSEPTLPPPAPPVVPVAPATVPLRSLVASRKLHVSVGTAVGAYFGRTDAVGAQYAALLVREYDVLTPENEMKFASLRPSRGVFRFDRADSMVAYAKANGMRARGHTLIWGSQLAAWLTAGSWTAADARQLLDEHVSTTVAHYRGQLAAWDVVNEALNEDGTLKANFWSARLGRAYVEQAFRAASAADPGVPLFYNDYNIESAGPKADSALAMLADLRARGVPVTGVGMQGHFIVGQGPTYAALMQNFARFAAAGLRIHVTELDIRATLPTTAAVLQTQAQQYADVYRACLDTPACEMVVSWGFTDLSSWIPSTFPGAGEALLFDAGFQPKPAYTAVNDLLARS